MTRSPSVTGLVLAGGRGSRMGGVDKGLQALAGVPLVQHAIRRLAPQVQGVALNANRHLDDYRALGLPVWPDADAGFAGPLAGFLAGLTACSTDWLVTVPCDTPNFPVDFVARLLDAVGSDSMATIATEEGGRAQRQPVFCLMRRSLKDDLAGYLAEGGRKIERWQTRLGCVVVRFEEAQAFFNANTIEELRLLGPG